MNSEGATRIAQAAFKPITWSVDDTASTVQQIKVHNAVGVKLGLWKYPKVRKHKAAVSNAATSPKKHWWQRKKKAPPTS